MEKNRESLVIFDLDGTILDTIEDLTISMNFALKKVQLPEHTREEVLFFIGNGIPKAVERAIRPVEDHSVYKRVLQTFIEHYREHCMDHTYPYPGIPELLAKLKQAGHPLAVVSNKADDAVQQLICLRFPDMFDAVVGISEGMHRKPAPDAVSRALSILEEKTGKTQKELHHKAVFIGDSDVDIQTARNAQMDEILVSWGFRGRKFLEKHGAKHIADSPEELEMRISQL